MPFLCQWTPGGVELADGPGTVRRKFPVKPWNHRPGQQSWILRQIQHLYRIEARLRENGLGPQLRVAIRCAESKPIVERMQRALIRLKSGGRYLPKSLLGIAMDYALGQWPTTGNLSCKTGK